MKQRKETPKSSDLPIYCLLYTSMAAFRTRHPGVVIKIVNGTSSELAEMLSLIHI